MKNKFYYTFEDDLKERLKNPKFRKAWEETEVEYQLARRLIEKRSLRKISQRELARQAKTTQAVISRIEGMSSNPSVGLLKRLAQALNSRLEIRFLPK